MKTRFLILALALICNFQLLWGQCKDISTACLAQPFVKHLEMDADLGASGWTIDLDMPGATSASWGFCPDLIGDCDDPDFDTSVSFASGLTFEGISTTRARLSGTPTVAGIYTITVRATTSSATFNRQYQFIVREPLRVVFVIDKSGSMGGTPPAGASTKWLMAEDAITQFVNGLNSDLLSLVDGDRICIVGFASDEAVPALPVANFRTVGQFVTEVGDFFSVADGGFAPGGGTSIGDGLAHAVDDLHGGAVDANLRQIMVLISDGMQNRDAMVDLGGKKLAGAGGMSLLNSPEQIDTYTIGFTHSDSPGAFEQLLINISSSLTNENYFYTTDIGTYTPSFADLFVRVFNQFSPQLIDQRVVQLPAGTTQGFPPLDQNFTVNGEASKLLLQVNFNQNIAGFFGYDVLKDGVPLTSTQYKLLPGNASTLLTVNFQENPELGSAGRWTVRLSDIPTGTDRPIRAVFTAIVDEHSFRADYEVLNDPTITTVGQAQVNTRLRPEVRLSLRGAALEGAFVTARLIEPGADKGTLIANTTIDYFVDSLTNPYAAKFRAIQEQDPDALDILYQFAENEIQLDDDGGGLYTGRFGQLDVADNASVIFRVRYVDSDLDTIQRYYRSSIPVRFGELEYNLGALGVSPSGVNTYTLEYRPQYFNGTKTQLVGPGYGPAISAQNGNILDIEDRGDGTYLLTIEGSSPNAEVDLYILDEPIYSGPLADFAKPNVDLPYDLSLHLGYAFPLADTGLLDSLGDGGLLAEIDFDYRVAPQWSVQLIGGYYDYHPTDNLMGAALHLRYHWLRPGQRLHWTASAGVGYYSRDSGDAVTGYGLRLGAQYQLSQPISLTAEIGGYSISDVSDMGLLAVGMKYRF